MSRPESSSSHGQDHSRPSTSSACHGIFSLCAALSEAASRLPVNTPDDVKRFCQTFLQKLPKDASSIESFQKEMYDNLLFDMKPVTVEFTADTDFLESHAHELPRVDDVIWVSSTDIDSGFSQITLEEYLDNVSESSASPFRPALGAIDPNTLSPSHAPCTHPRSDMFITAAPPPQVPRTPPYVGPSASASVASASTFAISIDSLRHGTPLDVLNNEDSSDSKEEERRVKSILATGFQDQEVSSVAIPYPRQAAPPTPGAQSNKRNRDESPDPVDQESLQKPGKFRRKVE